jgi:hypothetical protein
MMETEGALMAEIGPSPDNYRKRGRYSNRNIPTVTTQPTHPTNQAGIEYYRKSYIYQPFGKNKCTTNIAYMDRSAAICMDNVIVLLSLC